MGPDSKKTGEEKKMLDQVRTSSEGVWGPLDQREVRMERKGDKRTKGEKRAKETPTYLVKNKTLFKRKELIGCILRTS